MGSLELTQEGTPFAHEPIGNTRKRVREHAVRLLECQAESVPISRVPGTNTSYGRLAFARFADYTSK